MAGVATGAGARHPDNRAWASSQPGGTGENGAGKYAADQIFFSACSGRERIDALFQPEHPISSSSSFAEFSGSLHVQIPSDVCGTLTIVPSDMKVEVDVEFQDGQVENINVPMPAFIARIA